MLVMGSVDDKSSSEGVSGWAALAEKLLNGELAIHNSTCFAALLIGVVAWLFVQDNAANKLDTNDGVIWLPAKAVIFTTCLGTIWLVILAISSAYLIRRCTLLICAVFLGGTLGAVLLPGEQSVPINWLKKLFKPQSASAAPATPPVQPQPSPESHFKTHTPTVEK